MYKVDSALYNKKNIELAAREALETWLANQEKQRRGLWEPIQSTAEPWTPLAEELREWELHSTSSRPPHTENL